jgi:hypothetical protein
MKTQAQAEFELRGAFVQANNYLRNKYGPLPEEVSVLVLTDQYSLAFKSELTISEWYGKNLPVAVEHEIEVLENCAYKLPLLIERIEEFKTTQERKAQEIEAKIKKTSDAADEIFETIRKARLSP